MKKLLVVLLALTCLGAAAFADVTPLKITGSLETGAVVKMPHGGPNSIGLYDNDSGNPARFLLGISFTGADGNWGLITRLDAEGLGGSKAAAGGTGGTFAGFDRAVLWGSVFSGLLTLKAGALDEETFATWWEGWGNWLDGAVGLEALVKPIEGLTIGYYLPLAPAGDFFSIAGSQSNYAGDGSLTNALAASTIGVAWSMPNLLNVMLGYQNATGNPTTGKTGWLWGGADLKLIPNLLARVEFKALNLGGDKPNPAYTIFEEVGYTLGPIGLDLAMWQDLSSADNSKLLYNFEPSVSYDLGVAKVAVGGDYGIDNGYFWGVLGLTKMSTALVTVTNFDVVAWIQFPFGANMIKIGGIYAQADTSDSSTTSAGIFLNYRVFF